MKYLDWYVNKRIPEWFVSISVYTPQESSQESSQGASQEYLLENLPLYGYDYDLSIGQRYLEEILANGSAVEIAIPFTPQHQQLRQALFDERMVNVHLIKMSYDGSVLREILFSICNISRFKEFNEEVQLTFHYELYHESIKTSHGVMATSMNFGEYI